MLIALNFAVGALLVISMVVFEKYEGLGLLTGIILLPCFLALALVNVGAIFFHFSAFAGNKIRGLKADAVTLAGSLG
jgi:hypothetical protein